MQNSERLTKERNNGIKAGYWTTCKKDEVVQRLGQYEDTGLSPEEIQSMTKTGNSDSGKFDKFLEELKDALEREIRHGMRSYTLKICFIAEVLTNTAGNPVELSFTASEIKKALDLAKLK